MNNTRTRLGRPVATAALLVGLSTVSACLPGSPPSGPGGPATTTTTTTTVPRTVTMPAIPLPAAQSWQVSADALEQFGCDACDSGAAPDPARLFYGTLPLVTVDGVLDGTAADRRIALGNLFASGYFGGIYLRGALADGASPDLTPFAPVLDLIGAATQSGLDAVVGDVLRIAATGTDQEVRDASGAWAAVLAAIAGYNRGYLEVTLQHPPAGVTVPPGAFTCASLFDCRSTELPLASLTTLAGQRNKLLAPPDLTWFGVATAANAIGNAAVPAGRGVWDSILSGADFSPAAYRSIVDLSVGFLEVTQAAFRADLAGPTGGSVDLARRGLVATAALVTWAGSYFLGLASPLPNSAQPTLNC